MHATPRSANETQNNTPRVGMVLVRRAGHLEDVRIFTDSTPPVRPEGVRPCQCTSGGRDQALASCRHCKGEGWVR